MTRRISSHSLRGSSPAGRPVPVARRPSKAAESSGLEGKLVSRHLETFHIGAGPRRLLGISTDDARPLTRPASNRQLI
jgi:hypothetical protein